jgi:hypothetical protein
MRRACEPEERREAAAAKLMTCWRASKAQSVFRIAVQYPDGTTAAGWAKLGTWAFGLLSDVVNVRWDETKTEPPGFPVIVLHAIVLQWWRSKPRTGQGNGRNEEG